MNVQLPVNPKIELTKEGLDRITRAYNLYETETEEAVEKVSVEDPLVGKTIYFDPLLAICQKLSEETKKNLKPQATGPGGWDAPKTWARIVDLENGSIFGVAHRCNSKVGWEMMEEGRTGTSIKTWQPKRRGNYKALQVRCQRCNTSLYTPQMLAGVPRG
jgi:hypothetical protein